MIFIYLQSFLHHLEGLFGAGNAEVMGSNPGPDFFQALLSQLLSSVHNCEDRFHIR